MVNLAAYLLKAIKDNFQQPKSSREIVVKEMIPPAVVEQATLDNKDNTSLIRSIDDQISNVLVNLDGITKQKLEEHFDEYLRANLFNSSLKIFHEEGLQDKRIGHHLRVFLQQHYSEYLPACVSEKMFVLEDSIKESYENEKT